MRKVAVSKKTPGKARGGSKKTEKAGASSLSRIFEGLPAASPQFFEPMKAKLLAELPRGDDWVYEIKFDGFRGLAIKEGREARLLSRNNKDLGERFPGVVRALQKLPCERLVLDGEVVALDQQGRSSFQLLQRANDPAARSAGLIFYAFDILNANGKDLTGLPLMKRKAILKTLVGGRSDCILVSEELQGDVSELSAAMQNLGLEGMIAKKRHSRYEVGQRSGSWVKFKWGHEQEFVIGGYTDPEGSRPFFGSVLVGYYKDERLIFAAKVGTGFNTKLLKSLYDRFQKIRIDRTPFANLPERGGLLTAAQMRFCKWVEPELVCQVRFTEWTHDEHLRHPVFLGLREDKDPKEVVLEIPAVMEPGENGSNGDA